MSSTSADELYQRLLEQVKAKAGAELAFELDSVVGMRLSEEHADGHLCDDDDCYTLKALWLT